MSYILYLVDKDWGSGKKPDGGGLQLYPLETEGVPGIPAYAPSKTIPPRWNQMVLFAVQPGVSFHDVQEVRMAWLFTGAGTSRDVGEARPPGGQRASRGFLSFQMFAVVRARCGRILRFCAFSFLLRLVRRPR